MKQLLSLTKILILALIIGFGVSYAFAAWQDPTQAPPAGNTPAPINVGTIDQIKEAGLSLDKLAVFGQVVIKDGTEGAGKVLTSDADGLASWGTASSGGGSSAVTTVFDSDTTQKDVTSTYTTPLSVTLNTDGQQHTVVQGTVTGRFYGTGSGHGITDVKILLKKDGVTVVSIPVTAFLYTGNPYFTLTTPILFSEQPTAGAHTYTVVITPGGAMDGAKFYYNSYAGSGVDQVGTSYLLGEVL